MPIPGRRLAVLAGVVGAVAACAPLRPDPSPPPPPVKSALHFVQGIPLVAVHAPNDQTAWFVVDTGAGDFTFIDESLGKRIGLKYDIVRDPAIPFIHLQAPLRFLEVEGFGRRDLVAYVNEVAERSSFAGLDVKVEGALGTGYFRGQCISFDWGAGEFTANQLRLRRARHVPIPLRFGGNGELYLTVRVNGESAEALLDTASPQTLVTKELADHLKLPVDERGPPIEIETSIGSAAVREGSLARLGLGTEEVKDLGVVVVDRRMPHANVLLGTDVLARYGVILDLSNEPYLVLDPEVGAAKPEAAPPAAPNEPAAAPTNADAPKKD